MRVVGILAVVLDAVGPERAWSATRFMAGILVSIWPETPGQFLLACIQVAAIGHGLKMLVDLVRRRTGG